MAHPLKFRFKITKRCQGKSQEIIMNSLSCPHPFFRRWTQDLSPRQYDQMWLTFLGSCVVLSPATCVCLYVHDEVMEISADWSRIEWSQGAESECNPCTSPECLIGQHVANYLPSNGTLICQKCWTDCAQSTGNIFLKHDSRCWTSQDAPAKFIVWNKRINKRNLSMKRVEKTTP